MNPGRDVEPEAAIPLIFRGVRPKVNSRWDVVQIRETRVPGKFSLWISADSRLVTIPLRVPRELYVHLRNPPKPGLFKRDLYECDRVTRSLPRDHPCVNLYKLSVPEDVYMNDTSHFYDLTNNPNVDGVYEAQVSPHCRLRCAY